MEFFFITSFGICTFFKATRLEKLSESYHVAKNDLYFSLLYDSLIFPGVRLGADSQFSDFLDGLGPAQLVGRQTLATPAMGKGRSVFILKTYKTPKLFYEAVLL